MRLALWLMPVCLFAQRGRPAAEWYLDNYSGTGSDSNNCTSPVTPCLTVAGLLGNPILTGDLIAVKCGSYFREELTVPQNNVGLTIYGCTTLAEPVHVTTTGTLSAVIFDGADVISAGAWSKTGGQTSVYQTTLTDSVTGGNWVNAWENFSTGGPIMTRAASIAACDATAGSIYVSSDTTSPFTLYIHTTAGTNPSSNGNVYEYTARQAGYDSYSVTGARAFGITTQRNLTNDGSQRIGQNGQVYNTYALYGSKHNLLYREGANLYGVTAHQAYYGGQSSIMFVYNENTATGGTIVVRNSSATLDSYVSSSQGFYGHVNTGGKFTQVIYDNNSVTNNASGFAADAATNVLIYHGTVINAQSAASVHDGYRIDGLSGTVQSLANFGRTLDVLGGNVEISDLTVSCGSIYGIFSQASVPVNLYVHDSNWTTGGGALFHFQNSALITLTSKHNTLNNISNLPYNFIAADLVDLRSDFNTFTSGGTVARLNNSNLYELPQWRSMFRQDTHSTP